MIVHVVSSEVVPERRTREVRERVEDLRRRHRAPRVAHARRDPRPAPRPCSTATSSRADRVIDDDDAVDSLRHAIEDECLRILGGPACRLADLRFVGTTMRVVHELERSADLMVNIAKTTWRLHPVRLDSHRRPPRRPHRVGRSVVQMRVAVNAFVDRDPSWAAALVDMDDTIDELERRSSATCLAVDGGGADRRQRAHGAVQLALVARHYERIGDHAVTIAEQVPLRGRPASTRRNRRLRR